MDISYWFDSSHAGCFFRSITFRNICMTQQCGRFCKSAFTFATNIGLDPCLLAFRILLCRYSISLLAYTSVILEGRLLLRSWKMHKFASTLPPLLCWNSRNWKPRAFVFRTSVDKTFIWWCMHTHGALVHVEDINFSHLDNLLKVKLSDLHLLYLILLSTLPIYTAAKTNICW